MPYSRLLQIACLCVLAPSASAQLDDLRLPVIIDAEATDYDGKTSMLRFTGLRLTQGRIGIEADVALASRMDFDDSVWRFDGNVAFDVEGGHVTCDSANLEFSDFQLLVAHIQGSPATFEFQRLGSADTTYAEAENLHYDVAAGIIEFSGNARITEGGNEISSETLIYNIGEQRINAASSGNGGDRVTVTYTPPPADTPDDAGAAEQANDEDSGSEQAQSDQDQTDQDQTDDESVENEDGSE